MQKEREKGEEKRAFSIPAPFLPLEGDPPSLRRVKRYEISLYGGGGGGKSNSEFQTKKSFPYKQPSQ